MVITYNRLMRLVNALDLYLAKVDTDHCSNDTLAKALDVNVFAIKYYRKYKDKFISLYRIIFDHYYKHNPVYQNANKDLCHIDSFQDFKKFIKGESIWH